MNVEKEIDEDAEGHQLGSFPWLCPANDFMKVIDNAVKTAEKMGDSYATTEHLLIALAEDKGDAGRVLSMRGHHAQERSRRPTSSCAAPPA